MIRSELKEQAKAQLKGNLGMLFLCSLIIVLISAACGAIPVVGAIASIILSPPLALGLTMVYLNVTYGDKADVSTVFDGFKTFGTSIVLNILMSIFTFLWSLLLIIPGIIKGISYSMSFYILAENPDMSATDALNESKAIMEGHKMDYFVLTLSFIPWFLLMMITFGLAGIYVVPYMTLTITNFYHNIKRQQPVAAAADAASDVYAESNVIE